MCIGKSWGIHVKHAQILNGSAEIKTNVIWLIVVKVVY